MLATGWWGGLSLGWLGTPIWVWTGLGVLLTAGHAFSWYFGSWKSLFRSLAVGLAILGVVGLAPGAIGRALAGDWLPFAHFLLLFQAISAFELKTRGGLYASLGLSGVVLFIGSQRPLDVTFGVFMIGFVTLLLAFLAMSFLVDQVRRAEVRWFASRFAFAWFWSGMLILCLAISAAIFIVLPKRFGDPINEAHAVLLPIGASGLVVLPEVTGEPAPAETSSAEGPTTAGAAAGGSSGEGGLSPSPIGGAGERSEGAASPKGDQRTVQGTVGTDGSGTRRIDAARPEDVVMQVRSPVMTYWRGRVMHTFDGGNWLGDPAYYGSGPRDLGGGPSSALEQRPRYAQTYFIRRPPPPDTLYAGYVPIAASVHPKEGMLTEGSIYRVVSALPDFSSDALEDADPSARLDERYHAVPESLLGLVTWARQITEGAYTDLERARRIATYLDRNHSFDSTASDNLRLTSSPAVFLQQGSAGTAMDFATATVLLARAAGIPSRLVTGYLPGSFDPLSGTYVVREEDRHAWAEIYLGRVGWIPLDAAPRPLTFGLDTGAESYRFSRANGLFREGYGEAVYDSLRSSPHRLAELASQTLERGVGPVAMTAGAGLVVAVALVVWKRRPTLGRRGRRHRYATLRGDGRAEMLLRRAGLAGRKPSQTLTEHLLRACSAIPGLGDELTWMRDAAWDAAYNPEPYDTGPLTEARRRLHRLKAAIKVSTWRRRRA